MHRIYVFGWRPIVLAVVLVGSFSGCRDAVDAPDATAVIRVADVGISIADFDELGLRLAGEMALPPDDLDAVRRRVLEVLIAREVLLLEAESRGLLQTPKIASVLARRERELVVERLYEREVSRRAQPTKAQLDSLYDIFGAGEAVRARHILCATEEEARSVLAELADGGDFAELARTRSQHALSASMGGDMGYMRRDQLLPEMRDPVWQAPAGRLLPTPIHTRMGYHVIEVTEHRHRTFEEMKTELAGEIRRDLIRQRERELGARLRDRYRFRWDREVAAGVVAGRLTAEQVPDTVIAAWEGGAMTVEAFVQYSRQRGRREIEVDTAEARRLGEAGALRDLLWRLGRDEYLGETDPEIAGALRLARAELAGEALYGAVAGEVDVSAAALRQAYEANRDSYRRPPILRVQEILVDEKPLADSLAALIRGGADMAALATRFSKRVWAAPRGGDIGEITEGMPAYSRMARIARGYPVGHLTGPIPLHGGYSIFRVTNRKEGQEATFEEARAAVAEDLRNRAMDGFIDSLRQIYADRIRIDEQALSRTLKGMAP